MAKTIKFALVDESRDFHNLVKKNVNSGSVGDFYFNNIELGKANCLNRYDLIFIGNTGTSLKKEDLAESIHKKTRSIIIIISEENEKISNELLCSRIFRVVRRDTFNTYNDTKDFLQPFISIIESRQIIQSVKSRFKMISNNFDDIVKLA